MTQPSAPIVALWPTAVLARERRPLLLREPGARLTAGRRAAVVLPHASGADNEFLSRRALQIGLDAHGRAYLANLSQRHELVVRPWGRGAASDESLRPASGSAGPARLLAPGAYWVRNGRAYDPEEGRYGQPRGDDRTSWLFVEVAAAEPSVRTPDLEPGMLAAATTTVAGEDVGREWRLTDAQWRGVLIYFAQFLALPPAVVPQIPSDTAAERLGGRTGDWSRIDHLIASAARRGFVGGRAELLPWLIAEGHLAVRDVLPLARSYGLKDLLLPAWRYRPAGS